MSTTPQGPGWWQASDGLWYPPQSRPGAAPQYQQPYQQQPYQQQPYQQPGFAPGRPALGSAPGGHPSAPGFPPAGHQGFGSVPPKRGGVPKALIVLAVVVVAVVVGGYVAVSWAMDRVTDNVIGGDCDLVSTADVDEAMDGEFDVVQLGGLTSIATPVLDSRVLADATTCWATETAGDAPRLVRVAKLDTADAAARFQQERTIAQGVEDDRGGGVTVESQPYFNRDVQFGDEAFCTTTDMTGASGVLVRRGDSLVYVSLTSGTFSPDLSAGPDGSIRSADDDAHCDLAQRIAEKVG